eukprot:CAMPEP_0171899324 /NCGR_PEP_ID=MMETSP0992-20121227/49186_1 /TAXON_ID=483369 /ORGANISM="non described non described, Strain CCMP2098" /LENGTH=64 /DNA_ID=CAMNT_0012527667 /DNA_START=398 /DNA_END=589 /DNA_ORIENTATION=-
MPRVATALEAASGKKLPVPCMTPSPMNTKPWGAGRGVHFWQGGEGSEQGEGGELRGPEGKPEHQ